MIAESVEKNPKAEFVIMEKHGLVTWGDTSNESYDNTICVMQEAEEYMSSKYNNHIKIGELKIDEISEADRREILYKILPIIRGQVSENQKMIVTYDDSEPIMSFVNSVNADELSRIGAACPDHLVHT